jgi:hypothetical protein
MLREDKNSCGGILRTDLAGCTKSFVRMGRRHPDVHQGDLRATVADAAKQSVCIADLVDNVHAVVHE